MNESKFSRRSLLARLGAGAALLPLLHASARAATPKIKRFVVMQTTNGVIHKSFWPQSMDEKLTDLNLVSMPLKPFMSDIIMVGGLTLQNMKDQNKALGADMQGHASFAYFITGSAGAIVKGGDGQPAGIGNSISIDEHVAAAIMKTAPQLPRRSLHLGAIEVDSDVSSRTISFRGPAINGKAQDNDPQFDPNAVYRDLMSLGVNGQTNAAQAADIARLRLERKSVLDFVNPTCTSLSRYLGSEDRAQVQQHCDNIRSVETQLDSLGAAPTGANCSLQAPPAGIAVTGDKAWVGVDKILPVQVDLAFMAMRCDITRVATVQMVNNANFMLGMPFLGAEFNVGGEEYPGHTLDHHDMAHRAADGGADELHVRRKNTADAWFIGLYARMLQNMKNAKDADGSSMLDNSVVVLGNHFSQGANHTVDGLPFIIAGKGGGYFSTGRVVRLGGAWNNYYTARSFVPHNGLLCALANAMDAPVSSFGDPRYGGEVAGIKG